MSSRSSGRARVLIAGAGIAGLEAALALNALARDRVRIEMLEPDDHLLLAPEATIRPFGTPREPARVAPLAERAGVALRIGRLAEVRTAEHLVLTDAGEPVPYDRLVIAVGARREPVLAGTLTFGGPGDVAAFRRMVGRMVRGARRGVRTRLAFVVPGGTSWPLGAYELALMTARHLRRRDAGRHTAVALVTSEDRPLGIFGPEASAAVADDLADAGIELYTGSVVRDWSWGRLTLVPEGHLAADRVVALPALRGPAIPGLAHDAHGFVRADRDGSVVGAPDVYVVGDAGSFAVKQGGIACQQADSVAATIARGLGAPVEPIPFEPVLRGWLLDGEGGRFLRAGLPGGSDEFVGVSSRVSPLWVPQGKVAGRFLTAFLSGASPFDQLVDMPVGGPSPET